MRENTRCEVEEPMSTPTLKTTISSSSTSERPVEEKKMRPPCASSVMSRIRRCRAGKRRWQCLSTLQSQSYAVAHHQHRREWCAHGGHAYEGPSFGLMIVPALLPTLRPRSDHAPTNFGTTVPFL